MQLYIKVVFYKEEHPRPGALATERGFTDAHWELCRWCWNHSPRHRPHMREVVDALFGFRM